MFTLAWLLVPSLARISYNDTAPESSKQHDATFKTHVTLMATSLVSDVHNSNYPRIYDSNA